MWRRFSVLPTIIPLIGLTVMVDAAQAADTPNVQLLLERLRVLEERLNKLEGSEGSKQTVEYVCPRGVILKEAPPNGRCPDGTPPQVREAGEAVRAARDLAVSLGIHATNDLDDDLWNRPYAIVEIDYHSSRLISGNYRLWARVSTIQKDDDALT
jgi:hypothetical protein